MFLADAGEYELLFDYLNRINLGISSDYSWPEWDKKLKDLKWE
jgi:hypothetical protein